MKSRNGKKIGKKYGKEEVGKGKKRKTEKK